MKPGKMEKRTGTFQNLQKMTENDESLEKMRWNRGKYIIRHRQNSDKLMVKKTVVGIGEALWDFVVKEMI